MDIRCTRELVAGGANDYEISTGSTFSIVWAYGNYSDNTSSNGMSKHSEKGSSSLIVTDSTTPVDEEEIEEPNVEEVVREELFEIYEPDSA